jgi:hypothetical protein
MEHRWGERTAADLPVLLDLGCPRERSARLRDVSISGCRVELLNPDADYFDSEVEVILATITEEGEALRLYGSIVRRTPEELGIEWAELAPPGIHGLLQRLSRPLTDSLPACAMQVQA